MELEKKIIEMQNALLTIQRLMPQVEAELSRIGGVGAAKGTKVNNNLEERIIQQFYKTTKIK